AKVHTYTRRRRTISTASGGISTAKESISTAGASMPASTAGMVDKAVRLQERLDEEERQTIARMHEEASSFNVEEWEDIQATTEADEEIALRIQAGEMEKYSEAEKANESSKRVAEEELEQESSKRQNTRESSEPREKEDDELTQEDLQQMMMMKFDRDDLVQLWSLVKERSSTTKPTGDKEKELWVEVKRLFEPDVDDTLWKLQRYMHDPLVWSFMIHVVFTMYL
nr:hypothetical protein [Tanacetum cinerariifolium]